MASRFAILPALAVLMAACSSGPQQQAPAGADNPQGAPAGTAAPATPGEPQPSQVPAPATQPPATTTPAPATASPAARPAPPTPTTSRPATRPAEPPAAALAEKPAPEPKPEFREVTIPAGTKLSVRLATPISSDKSQLEDEVRGTLTQSLVVDGLTAVPAGAEVVGTVRDVKRSGRVKGLASVTVAFERLVVRTEPHSIRTERITRQAEADRSDDVKKGAIGGGAGAIVGGILGGGKGAAIGAGVGAAGAVVATRGDEITLAAGTVLATTLTEPMQVVVPLQNR